MAEAEKNTWKTQLEYSHPYLRNDLPVAKILPALHPLLTATEYSRVRDRADNAGSGEGVDELVDILAAKDEQTFDRFCSILEDPKNGCSGVAKVLKEDIVMLKFKSFGHRFVMEVRSREPAFLAKLHQQNVVPEETQKQIASSSSDELANFLFFGLLCYQESHESLCKLLAAMIEAEDHPTMSKLGREMKATLGL